MSRPLFNKLSTVTEYVLTCHNNFLSTRTCSGQVTLYSLSLLDFPPSLLENQANDGDSGIYIIIKTTRYKKYEPASYR